MLLINPLFGHAADFSAERIAVKLNLPLFAISSLRNHILDAFPKGEKCRLLLAEAELLRKNFQALHRHLQLLPKTHQDRVWLDVLDGWYNDGKLSLTQLLFSPQTHPTACFLRDLNTILSEPIGSVRWTAFWQRQKSTHTFKEAEALYQTALEMKFSMFPQSFPPKQKLRVWQFYTASLSAQQRYEELKKFLLNALPKLRSSTEKARCLLWLLKTFNRLNENTDDLMRNHASVIDRCPSLWDAVVSEWLASKADPLERLRQLQLFYELYKKKHKTLHMQYLQLLQAQQWLELKQFGKAREVLGDEFSAFEPSLQASAYELAAKLALTETPPSSYTKAADALGEASRHTSDASKRLFYAQLQSDCLCTAGDCQRAYCVCEEALQNADPKDERTSRLAETWCECGILCNETAEEFEQQLSVCRERFLFEGDTEQRLRLSFAEYHFEKEDLEKALSVLNPQMFTFPLRNRAYLWRGKCFLHLGNLAETAEALKQIATDTLSHHLFGDYLLCQSTLAKDQSNLSAARHYLDRFFELKNLPTDLNAQAVLLQGNLYGEKGEFSKATETLKNFAENTPNDWKPLVQFRAADYAEKNQTPEEAIALFEKLYESNPQHPLAKDGRLRQGTLLLNLQKAGEAKTLLEALLPNLEGEQALWCRYLSQKCAILSGQTVSLSELQLESLLKEELQRA
ncbi:MAG: tetratricopeptide repeat protein, partial [Opitutales bacterium]|nr:tetratricopeptide repeat protein [Opitutales bacterium]